MTAQIALHFPPGSTGSAKDFGALLRPARPAAARFRLTRRGRLLLVGLPLMLLAAALLTLAGSVTAPATASGDPLVVAEPEVVTVGPGESLWSLAVELAPGQDPREVVAEIVQLNNLDTPLVHSGRQLFVPAVR
jgi:hypothetical protein